MTAPASHPVWCLPARCARLKVHVSPVLPVDAQHGEDDVIDVALVQEWRDDAHPQVSATVQAGTEVRQVLMSTGQAQVFIDQVGRLLELLGEVTS
ncbi:hypothetical protein [Verrucosispora sp. NA02020]|uniref:hypothetical protein n=1 Tax=Verrucosispora sp. NA02020 TaxID=2742132 RepID=UPI003D72F412